MNGMICPECATEYWDEYCPHCYMPVERITVKVGNKVVAKIVMLSDEYSPLYEDKLQPVVDGLIDRGVYNYRITRVAGVGANTLGWE